MSRAFLCCLLLDLLALLAVPTRTRAAQTPFLWNTKPTTISGQDTNEAIFSDWDLGTPPSVNETGHLVFDTVNSLLQHWPNTRYRNGHNIVPGIVPPGTLLYHGRGDANLPPAGEWVATDPEHSYIFCSFGDTCWLLTLVATRPLNVIYFDGSSAAKMPNGSMDTQDIVSWGKIKPEWYFQEKERIKDLCKWGEDFGIDGFARMEMDFEIMLCNFTRGVEVSSFLNLYTNGGKRRGPRPPSNRTEDNDDAVTATAPPVLVLPNSFFEVIRSGAWHDHYPGERRIKLDYTRIVSFYDTSLAPSLVDVRFGRERWDHRVEGISEMDLANAKARLEGYLISGSSQGSGVDWDVVIKTVAERYVERFEMLEYILDPELSAGSTTLNKSNATDQLQKANNVLFSMLSPYILASAISPPKTEEVTHNDGNLSWAEPIFEQCAIAHTKYVSSPSLVEKMTPSEVMLLHAVQTTSKEICRVVTRLWAQVVTKGVQGGSLPSRDGNAATDLKALGIDNAEILVQHWKKEIKSLMAWLDWSVWVKCRPACSFEEYCYLPTWPFFTVPRGPGGGRGRGRRPPGPPGGGDGPRDREPGPGSPPGPGGPGDRLWSLEHLEGLLPGDGDQDTWVRPQPKCIRRMEPFDEGK